MTTPEQTEQPTPELTFDDLLRLPDDIPRSEYPAHLNHPLHRKRDVPQSGDVPHVENDVPLEYQLTDYEIAAKRQQEWYKGVVAPRLGAATLSAEVSVVEQV